MRLFKHDLTGCIKAAIKAQVELPKDTAKSNEGFLASLSAIVSYLLKLWATDYNILTVNADRRGFKQGSLTATDYAQYL